MYFRVPFANSGSRVAIDLTNAADGPISYTYGYGSDYSLPRSTDPAALNVERLEFNELMFQVTSAIQQYQQFSTPDFITSADNGGSPFSYSQGVRVKYSGGFYVSLSNSNTELPTNPAAWSLLREDYAYLGQAQTFSGIQTIGVNGTPLVVNSANSTANKITLQDNAVTRGFIAASGSYAVAASLAAGTLVGGWDVSGNLVPSTTATYDLGTTSLVYRNVIANRFTVSGSAAPTNGIYLPSASVVGVSVGSALVASFSASGINSTIIGASTPAAGTFTTLNGTVITASTNFAGNLTGNVTGNASTATTASTATALATPRAIGIAGATGLTATGINFDGTAAINLSLAGTLVSTSGGTGFNTTTTGDLLQGAASNAWAKLAAVATGNALISGGVGVSSSWGKIGLTTHVSGTLPVANGGTGVSSATGSGNVVLSTSPTITTPNIVGTATNDNAAAGSVGQIIESTLDFGSATAMVSNTPKTITSISLPAGDYDVWGNIGFIAAGTALPGALIASISQVNNSHATPPGNGAYTQFVVSFGTNSTNVIPAGTTRMSLASTTTIYLVGTVQFSVGTCTAYGYIGARRVR